MSAAPIQKLKDSLVTDGLITDKSFDTLLSEAEHLEQDVADVLISRGIISRSYYYDFLSSYFKVEKAGLDRRGIDEEVLKKLPEEIARQKRAVFFGKEADGAVDAALEDPGNLETVKFLEKTVNGPVKIFLALPRDLDKAFVLYGHKVTQEFRKVVEENIGATLKNKLTGTEEAAKALPIVAIIDEFLSYAKSLQASDIHIEVLADTILVRFRVDGILHEIIRIPKEAQPALVARVKLLSGLKLDEHQKPQDGRFRYKIGGEILDIRVSVIPVFYGEKVEMRLLAAAQKPLSLEELGLLEDVEGVVRKELQKSYGMVLSCGPTGSGKTTTLYSILNILNKPEVNIVTVEDPIEYDIKYINQTQINPQSGITFANGLRAILRQDPNIIMVGEIRDEETAEIAVNAALTGHLLLSSLHTNDAATSVPRLSDMKVPPFLIAAVLNVSVAQRLVRKICISCIGSYDIDEELSQSISSQLKNVNPYSKLKIPKVLYRGRGCDTCGGIGYRGRLGIFEVLQVDEEIREFIVKPDFSLSSLDDLAKKKGMVTMFEDGLRKAEKGMTTIEEVLRVVRE